jgi:hypothetical protein
MATTVDRNIVSGNSFAALGDLQLTYSSHTPDNKGVNYQVFLRALHKFAKVEMRLGR